MLSATALPRVAQPCSGPPSWFRSPLPEGEGAPTDVRPRLATNCLGAGDLLLETADGGGVPTTVERVPLPPPTIGPAEFMPDEYWIVLLPVAPLAPRARYRLLLVEEPPPAPAGVRRTVEFVTGDGPAQTPVPAAVLDDLWVRQSAPHRCDGGSSVVATADVPPPPALPGLLLVRVLVGPRAALDDSLWAVGEHETDLVNFGLPDTPGQEHCLAVAFEDLTGRVGPRSEARCYEPLSTEARAELREGHPVALATWPAGGRPAGEDSHEAVGCGCSAVGPAPRHPGLLAPLPTLRR